MSASPPSHRVLGCWLLAQDAFYSKTKPTSALIHIDNIPLEILHLILSNVAQYDYHERFPTLTSASKRETLSARAVWAAHRTHYPLRQLFVTALEEMLLTISGREDARGWDSGLDALSRSEYAYDITILSFCPMVFIDGQL